MATKKPRLTITLNDDTYSIIKAFADVQNRSMSSVINEVLTEVSPSIARVASMLFRAQSLNDSMMRSIADDLEEASFSLRSHFNDESIDEVIKRVSGR